MKSSIPDATANSKTRHVMCSNLACCFSSRFDSAWNCLALSVQQVFFRTTVYFAPSLFDTTFALLDFYWETLFLK